jgi:hypothetical protein
MWHPSEEYPMRALQSRSRQKLNLKAESSQALQLLACSPRGATEDVLVVGHGLSRETLAELTLAGLAKMVTETLRAEGGTFTIDRLRITDAGRRAIGG